MKREIAGIRERLASATDRLRTLAFKNTVFGDEIKAEDLEEIVARDLAAIERDINYLDSIAQ